jgi:hypothetical protein
MNTKQKLHQLRLNEWSARFADQKASSLTVRQWCEQNQISIHTYNYWKHALKEELVNQMLPDIVPVALPVPSPSTLSTETETSCPVQPVRANRANCATAKLTINDISIEIDSTVSETFLRTLIKAVRYA